MEAAKETASKPIKINKPWFDFNKETLVPLMEERNRLLFEIKDPADLSERYLEARKDDLRRMQRTFTIRPEWPWRDGHDSTRKEYQT